MSAKSTGHSRKRVVVHEADERKIWAALQRWASTEDFVALRTRAMIALLWDGALHVRAAVDLNIEELASLSRGQIEVAQEARQRPCEGNRYKARNFPLSERTRDALGTYLEVVLRDGWLPGAGLQGPLFLSSRHHGRGRRVSRRTAVHSWRTFQQDHVKLSREYQLDDIVFTARLAFLQAGSDPELLSEHAGFSELTATRHRTALQSQGALRGATSRSSKKA